MLFSNTLPCSTAAVKELRTDSSSSLENYSMKMHAQSEFRKLKSVTRQKPHSHSGDVGEKIQISVTLAIINGSSRPGFSILSANEQ
jgi:hypothetical protein